ncbi:Rhs family protein, partial [Pseudomonas amygdali pv. morsprunorum str. M302280]
YEYDKAIRLIALTNENDATYNFAYDNFRPPDRRKSASTTS